VLVVRTAAVLLFAYVLPLDWQHVRDPGWAVLLATGLVMALPEIPHFC
jgi:hypothetical protein